MDVVAEEAAKLGSIKIAFHKSILFRREKAERGPGGEILYDKMKHFFKGPQHIITRETSKKEEIFTGKTWKKYKKKSSNGHKCHATMK